MNTPIASRCAWLLAALALALPIRMPAQALDEALKNFKAAPVVETSNSTEVGYASNVLREWDTSQSQLSSLDGYIDNSDFNNALNQARQYSRNARTPEVRKLWENLIVALQTEAKARETAFNQKVDEICTRSGKLAVAATKSAELDGVIDELYALQETRNNSYNNRLQRTYSRVDNTLNFLNSWQEYLGQLESGDIDSARNSLRNLNSNGYRYRPVSRSEVIKLIANLKTPGATTSENLLDGITLDNVATYRDRALIEQQSASGLRPAQLSGLLNDLNQLIRATAELKINQIGSTPSFLYYSSSHPYTEEIQRLKNDFCFRAIPKSTGLSDLGAPTSGETAIVYLNRLLDESIQNEDWPRARRLAATERLLSPGELTDTARETTNGANPTTAIEAWVKGQRMDKAAQPYAAADFYRQALAAGAPAKLEEKITARLRELATEFPDSAKLPR